MYVSYLTCKKEGKNELLDENVVLQLSSEKLRRYAAIVLRVLTKFCLKA
jgi:hypothetical protein